MKKLRKIVKLMMVVCLSFQAITLYSTEKNCTLQSPDRKINITVNVKNGQVFYAVAKNNKTIISPSLLGFQFKNIAALDKDFTITSIDTSTFDETWEQPWGERRYVKNNYRELTVHLLETTSLKRKLDIIFRVFNDGFGFRYSFPQQTNLDSLIISDELTEFNLPVVHNAWWIPVHSENSFYESLFRLSPINKMDTANTPLTIECKDGTYLAIHEANLTDYASMTLLCKDSSRLKCELVPWSNGDKVYAKAPFNTPWRTVIIADKPGDLVVSNLMLNLNEPSVIKDMSWIKPAKYIGIWWGMHMEKYTWSQGPKHGATTENTMNYIDFAAENGFDGVLVEGWNYGWDGDWVANGKDFSFTKPYPDFDIVKLGQYAASKKVKIIGHHETGGAAQNYIDQIEDAFKLYNANGIDAVKTGYVNKYIDGKEWHDGQYAVRHYRKVIETAAKYKIMIDNHEPVKPTGLCRTYPNFMTQEGARGQEYDAWSADGGNPPSHTTILPFTRMLAGPLDFTPGTFNFTNTVKPNTKVQTTLAKQLAMYMIIYSPQQMASDLPENYVNQKGFEFIKDVPCDWYETVVLNAKIGEYVTIARKDRNSDDWYIGSITNENAREFSIDLNFLDKNTKYTAQIYSDGPNADWKTNPTDLAVEEKNVTSDTVIKIKLAPGGGQAIRLIKNK